MAQIIESAEQLDFSIYDLPTMPQPKQVLMVEPTYFSVDYVINPHMADNVGKVDKLKAQSQWDKIYFTFEQIGLTVHQLEGQEGLPDMVFCANQSLPAFDGVKKHVIMSIMHADERKKEVPYIEQWYRQHGYVVHFLDEEHIQDFEGCGDAIWHTDRRLLWGGYGYRSSLDAYRAVADKLDLPIVTLELVDESFYHLDTCFCVLNETTVLIYPDAFTKQGLELINAVFGRVVKAGEYEAKALFACNATCPDGKNVIIQQGCSDVNKKLHDAGFSVHEVDTSEFLKSGGSVFCMKQLLW
ncbi:arginine deiminase family protein [Aliifodinibius sp. S!AR15-10]|uniref:dimethylarginine dimethylaminohydrolase family protein n=1 Tax=Aliifodinibius sp. S!AR15-10 TaxID=2950437 RepID=UPI00285E52D4|nr:arginine deiminase-related protein [Aliifodinibius sp. S!AR15-10]MDR8392468.1 arginine deiminase family protein [Aliifodinibius sp. S!AR15-10]